MDIIAFRDYCLSLKAVSESTPFGPDTLVFKVLDKVFCICDIEFFESFNVKAKPEDVIALQERYHSIHPGYHMNKKHWITVESANPELNDTFRQKLVLDSYTLVVKGMSKKQQLMLEKAHK